MHIAILGTSSVGPALGRAFRAAGHPVTIGTRNPEETRSRPEWADSDLPLAAYPDLQADVFVNATSGAGALAGFPPTLFVSNTDSLAEQPQRLSQESTIRLGHPMFNLKLVR